MGVAEPPPKTKNGVAETTPKSRPPLFGMGWVRLPHTDQSRGGRTTPMAHETGSGTSKALGGGFNHPQFAFLRWFHVGFTSCVKILNSITLISCWVYKLC